MWPRPRGGGSAPRWWPQTPGAGAAYWLRLALATPPPRSDWLGAAVPASRGRFAMAAPLRLRSALALVTGCGVFSLGWGFWSHGKARGARPWALRRRRPLGPCLKSLVCRRRATPAPHPLVTLCPRRACSLPSFPLAGAGSGIGRAVSVRLAREGATVAACDLDAAAAQETVRLLRGPGSAERAALGAHAAFQTDVSETGAAKHLLEQVQASFSRPPSVVVSSAGITRDEFLLHMSEDGWDKVLAVNLKGTFLVTQAAAQALVSSGCHGSIINISSIVGKVGNLTQTNYAASKAGVIGLTQAVALELGRHGIRCNCVLPGFIVTPLTQKVPQKVQDKVIRMVPMGRMGIPEDVADVVAFLASEDSGYITGASVEVTGGLFM
ncbi:(3R)-3-hydroxyacyl-CoA dehydrogenase [Echinops telfairi]|uniref:(3R)-3-hydroxyacyl-CoA dehydrogenase n=1 Tax=Echinops telfairi TaxID=9371 RepID=A0AC55D8Z4_ECHTE|nr:(3R)-3-hydroxyacyl-CoA dehydrogenase [Echinops telfairi]